MSDFAGVVFEAVEDAWQETATSAVSVRGFPGGDNVAISFGGQREVTRTVTLYFSSRGDWITFVTNRGNDGGTLTIDGWDSVAAVLKEASADPPLVDGRIKAKATFILK
jgi:hypothetical protein